MQGRIFSSLGGKSVLYLEDCEKRIGCVFLLYLTYVLPHRPFRVMMRIWYRPSALPSEKKSGRLNMFVNDAVSVVSSADSAGFFGDRFVGFRMLGGSH